MDAIISLYISLMPAILAGVATSAFCKSGLIDSLRLPMDGGRTLRDGRRIFGEHKTWKGFFGYIVFNAALGVLWGWVCKSQALSARNLFYALHENSALFNLRIGILEGLAYALFELPNSFMKRRLGIAPGKAPDGFLRGFFIFLDQADSVFGCVLVLCLFYPLSAGMYILYVMLGALTHIVFNMLLYALGVRRNMF